MNDNHLQETFTAHIMPAVERHARIQFRNIKCPDRKADLIAECIGIVWKWLVRMAQRGKDGTKFPTAIATFAARAVRAGRTVCGQERAKDALSPRAQQRHHFAVGKLPDFSTLNGNPLQEALIDNTVSPVDEQAAFRVDFPDWLSRFDSRRRAILTDMAMGHRTNELADEYGVIAGRICEMRREAAEDWECFHGGQAA